AAAGLDAGLQLGSRRLASPAQLAPRLLEAAGRLRQSRGAARAQVAGEVQRHRASFLGRAGLWQGAHATAWAGEPDLPRGPWQRAVPIRSLVGPGRALVAAADARVVPGRRDPG